jgi:hypothetical protein
MARRSGVEITVDLTRDKKEKRSTRMEGLENMIADCEW